jgi:hypothetical protein
LAKSRDFHRIERMTGSPDRTSILSHIFRRKFKKFLRIGRILFDRVNTIITFINFNMIRLFLFNIITLNQRVRCDMDKIVACILCVSCDNIIKYFNTTCANSFLKLTLLIRIGSFLKNELRDPSPFIK